MKAQRPANFVKILVFAFLLILMFAPRSFGAGMTVVTHGFEDDTSFPTWVSAMADQIPDYFHARYPGWNTNCTTYRLTLTYAGGEYRFTSARTNGAAPSTTESGEIIIELDWTALSGDLGDSYASTYGVAAAVSQILMMTNAISELNGHALTEFPIHLIGHSRGGSLVSQISYVLGTNGLWVDQVTSLDPYPLNNDGDIDPAEYNDASADHTYANFTFADDYWQDLGAGVYFGDPDGEPVSGAYVRQLTDLGGGYNTTSDFGTYHSNVHLWYFGTIDLGTPPTTPARPLPAPNGLIGGLPMKTKVKMPASSTASSAVATASAPRGPSDCPAIPPLSAATINIGIWVPEPPPTEPPCPGIAALGQTSSNSTSTEQIVSPKTAPSTPRYFTSTEAPPT